MSKKYTNRLIYETSPYLLQHAHNPVDWYPWGTAAFKKAERENKPILVSIGYSTCHWCHVMERESFENEDIANYMNQHFVCIKVDREERPDVDQIYMDAVQILTGQGGWPLNCFLLPDRRPFFAGTYFPPKRAYNRPSWPQMLFSMAKAFYEKRKEVEEQASRLMMHLEKSDTRFINQIETESTGKALFDFSFLETVYYKIRDGFDRLEGGFGNAPKFPQTMSLTYCLDYYFFTQHQEAIDHVTLSLDKMIRGGIYDQLGGGFARYSTDRAWLVPHFEKMLYDNALLVSLLSDAYKLTKKTLYKETIIETLAYIAREMTSEEGGFYSAQDADSEGIEGKYYVWSKAEIKAILGADADLFNAFYDVTETGNWEHVNILRRLQTFEAFATQQGLEVADFKQKMAACRAKLFKVRDKRIKPGLDDKILLNWNALMCSAYAKAYTALGDERYKTAAKRNLAFIFDNMTRPDGDGLELYHTYRAGECQYAAFLNDYAFLIEALLNVYSITQNLTYLEKAHQYTTLVIRAFYDSKEGLFYFTSAAQNDIIIRRKELYDSALPSGNSTMLHNLQQLHILLDKPAYRSILEDMLAKSKHSIEHYPSSFAKWARAAMLEVYPLKEIAIVGAQAHSINQQINQLYLPNKVVMATLSENEIQNEAYPLLKGKSSSATTPIFVCQNYSCQLPVQTIDKFKALINYKF